MEAWHCGKGVEYALCYAYDNCRTKNYLWWGWKAGESGAGHIRSSNAGANDWFSSIWLRPYDDTTKPAITIFKDRNCRGDSAFFYAGESVGDK